MRQLVNLYLDKVLVYPEYVEIHLNSISGSHIPSSVGDTPALGGNHSFCFDIKTGEKVPKKAAKKGANIMMKSS